MTLAGIIYLHDISQPRMESAKENIEVFDKLRCPGVINNVILATTKWGDVSMDVALRREQQLGKYWAGSDITRFHNTVDSAQAIVNLILQKTRVDDYQVQEELANLLQHLDPMVKPSVVEALFTLFGKPSPKYMLFAFLTLRSVSPRELLNC
jgi:hypothetical protein